MENWTQEDTIGLMRMLDKSDRTRKSIQVDALWDSGRFVSIDGNGKTGLLVGAIEDEYDYYLVVEGYDLKIVVSSCVGGYHIIEGELPQELSVLEWMRENDLEGLEERVSKQLRPYFAEDFEQVTDFFFDESRFSFK